MFEFPTRALSPLLVAAALLAAPTAEAAGELEIHILDVGQGASAFVRGPNGTRVLIDAGPFGTGNAVIRPYLASLGVFDLDWAIATHFDGDHIGGMDEVFNGGYLPLQKVWDRGNTAVPSTNQVSQYLAAAGTKRQTPTLGQRIDLGDGAYIECVALNGLTPLGQVSLAGADQQENGRSLATLISYGDFEAYIGGDLTAGGTTSPEGIPTANVEGPLASWLGQVEVVQASHHGSNTSSSVAVVNALDPAFVIYAAGLDNDFGHPTKTVTNRWNTTARSRAAWGTTEGDTSNGSGGWVSADGSFVLRTDGVVFEAEAPSRGLRARFATFENPGTAASAANLRVNELLVRPSASGLDAGQWIELVNIAAVPVDLGGVRLVRGPQSFTLASRHLLEPGGFVVLGLDGKPSRNGDTPVVHGAPWEQFALPTAAGTLELRSASGATIESVTWGGSGFAPSLGASAERIDAATPPVAANFAAATTAWSSGDLGTPGEPNGGGVSAPPTLAVVGPTALGGTLQLALNAPGKGFQYHILFGSQTLGSSLNLFGYTLPHQPDPFFNVWLTLPGVFGQFPANGAKQWLLPIPNTPSLVGLFGTASYLTLDFAGLGFLGTGQSNTVLFVVQP